MVSSVNTNPLPPLNSVNMQALPALTKPHKSNPIDWRTVAVASASTAVVALASFAAYEAFISNLKLQATVTDLTRQIQHLQNHKPADTHFSVNLLPQALPGYFSGLRGAVMILGMMWYFIAKHPRITTNVS